MKAFEWRARGAWWVPALLISQGHHFDHGTNVTVFTATRASVAKRIEDIGYLLLEGLGNVEGVAADVEEGAAAAKAVPEAGQVVADAVEGAKPPDEVGGDPLTGIDGDPSRNLTLIIAAHCPTVGANCRGNLGTDVMGMA
jgi:hypothetical protein